MKWVMQMKKALTALLVLVLLLSGFLFWKGAHHAVYLTGLLEEWLEAENADQSLTLQLSGGTLGPKDFSLTADTFWTEYEDRRLFGLSAQGVTVWTEGENLYMDTGNAYGLPELSGLNETTRRLKLGLLLYGRVTKKGDNYHLSMNSEELELTADITADSRLRKITASAQLPDGTAIDAALISEEAHSHPIPLEISDAIVRARMEPPMPLTEPLEILLPAFQNLLPLQGDLTLGVECGILELSETVAFAMDTQTARLERKGSILSIDLPDELSGADPALLGLVLLRNGTFRTEGDTARFEVSLTAEATTGLCAALVPQIEDLGMDFTESCATVTIEDGTLTAVSLTADGEVPFLFTTIPVYFSATLTTS